MLEIDRVKKDVTTAEVQTIAAAKAFSPRNFTAIDNRDRAPGKRKVRIVLDSMGQNKMPPNSYIRQVTTGNRQEDREYETGSLDEEKIFL